MKVVHVLLTKWVLSDTGEGVNLKKYSKNTMSRQNICTLFADTGAELAGTQDQI